ncbi:hypothetical protein [Paenibacillus daejeonensis]|uniref:hypothetical protein n=1 Tax=Paenibacillus daejeonensis TaxID=135193 RepID=UPI00037A2D7C|nr:hypothetical protein [Paenibacillus daejeonensis]
MNNTLDDPCRTDCDNNHSGWRRLLICMMAVCVTLALASGCNYTRKVQDSEYDYGSQQADDPKMMGSRMFGPVGNQPDRHNNSHVEYSYMLSRKLSKTQGIAAAVVMLTDKNAYVGLVLDWTALGTKRAGGEKMREQNNTGTTKGVYNIENGSPYWDNRDLVRPYNSYFSVSDHEMISAELKQTVAVKLRQLSPYVQEVHISANRHFVNELVDYARETWMGRPLQPYLTEFNKLVDYEFGEGTVVPLRLRQMKEQAAAQD